MMTFRLPCVCGGQVKVTEAMAGASATCACGREITIPSLNELRRPDSSALPPPSDGAEANPIPVRENPDTETAKPSVMGNVIGFASALVWGVFLVPWISRFIFPVVEGWNWKQTLLAALGAPFFFGFGKSIAESITHQREQRPHPSNGAFKEEKKESRGSN